MYLERMRKHGLALALALIMIAVLMPFGAAAAGDGAWQKPAWR